MKTKQQHPNMDLSSTLLVAAPEYCCGNTEKFNYLPQFTVITPLGHRDNVQLVILNCNSKDDIENFLAQTIKEMQELPEQEQKEQTSNLYLFNSLLKQIEKKEIAPIYNALKSKAAQLVGPFVAEMMYLCTDDRLQQLQTFG